MDTIEKDQLSEVLEETQTGSQSPPQNRSALIDIVKGLAITLVVFEHTAQGLEHRGWWSGPGYMFMRTFVYSFHMPAFFIVSGLFLMRSLKARGLAYYIKSKIGTILYPYLLWVLIAAATALFRVIRIFISLIFRKAIGH